MKRLLTVAVLCVAGCVSVPLPPTGENAGKYGFVDVRIQYRPNLEQVWSRAAAAANGKEVIK